MIRSGYSEDWCDDDDSRLAFGRWRGAVRSAIRGRRGQAFLRDLLAALESLPEKRLITGHMEGPDGVCAIGALGRARAVDMAAIDKAIEEADENPDAFPGDEIGLAVAKAFDIAPALAREIMFENDYDYYRRKDDPDAARYRRVVLWCRQMLAGGVP